MPNNPWDPFPLPTRGDDLERKTFAGVGHVMSNWEAVEFELARLYSFFVGDPDGPPLQQGYGAGRIFQERLVALGRVAEAYYTRWPNQFFEGEFDRLTSAAQGFSDRRNEVAHGIVMRADHLSFFRRNFSHQSFGNKPQHLLIPPLYTLRKHQQGLPAYAYSADELRTLASALLTLVVAIRAYREAAARVGELRQAPLASSA